MAKDEVVISIKAKDETKKGIDKAENSFRKLGKTIAPLVAAGFGIAAVKAVTDAYIRQENAIAQLDARLRSTGNTVGFTSKQLQNFASQLQGVTKFGDEAIIEMQSLLLTFTKIGGETFPQATEAILNVSTAMGQDLQTAAIQVGKALNDPVAGIGALSRSGIQFTDVQKDMIKEMVALGDTAGAQTIILKELETQFGGAARAAKDTLGGALQSAENDIGDLAESIGGILAPTIAELADVASFAARALREMIDPTLQGDLEAVNKEIEAMGGLLADMAAEGTAQNQLDFVEDQINALVDKRLELESKIAEINQPIAQQGEATTTAGVPVLTPAQAAEAAGKIADAELDILIQQLEVAELLRQNEDVQRQARNEQIVADHESRVQAEIAIEEAKQATINGILSNAASLMGSESRKLFEIGKVASLAQATVKTFEAAQSAYAWGAAAGGPVVGGIAAAAAVTAGLANIQKIQSTTFSGGGGGQAQTQSATGAAGAVGPVTQPQPIIPTIPAGGPAIRAESGSFIAQYVENELAPALIEAQKRGVDVVVT